jgi:amino-acid N-acetyltransferase
MTLAIGPARAKDLDAIERLLIASGLPIDGVRDCLSSTLVARDAGRLVGCAALELYRSSALLRSVAVDASRRGEGLGRQLTDDALVLASALGVRAVFLLTTTAGEFFPRFGFTRIERAAVPDDVRQSIEFTSACPASALVMRIRL